MNFIDFCVVSLWKGPFIVKWVLPWGDGQSWESDRVEGALITQNLPVRLWGFIREKRKTAGGKKELSYWPAEGSQH